MKRRVFVLGLDGGSWNLLDRLMAAGAMPHLKQACESGVKAVLESTVPPVTPVAWTSLMTGVNPGKHGIFSFTRPRDDNAYASLPQNRLNMRVPTLFDYFLFIGIIGGFIALQVWYKKCPICKNKMRLGGFSPVCIHCGFGNRPSANMS